MSLKTQLEDWVIWAIYRTLKLLGWIPVHLNFVNVQGILAQGIYDVHAIFPQFSDVKNGVQSQQPSILRQLVFGEPQCTEISHPEES